MTNLVDFKLHKAQNQLLVGEIILNSPSHLNALNLGMVNEIQKKLDLWREYDVFTIVLSGYGDKAFCAGGDVVSVRKNIANSGPTFAETFFAKEFFLDYQIHNYPKPIICWGSGIVMGGGMGLMNGCSHRIVTENSRLAMPEVGIGYYPDVGGSWFLNKVPEPFGLFLGLSGSPINGLDAIGLGLADYFVSNSRKEQLISELCLTSESNHQDINSIVDQIIEGLAESSSLEKGGLTRRIDKHGGAIEKAMAGGNLSDIYKRLYSINSEDKWIARMQKNLAYGSPLAALVVQKQLKKFKGLPLWDIFKKEMIMTAQFLRHREFPEGVRARLVDKDNNPNWTFKEFTAIKPEIVDNFFNPPWDKNPLDNLNR